MEILLLLYLLSGIIKHFLLFFKVQLPIDFTLLLGGLIVIQLGLKILRDGKLKIRKDKIILFSLFVVFIIWTIITFFYSPSLSEKYSKLIGLSTALVGIIPVYFYPRFDVRRFLKMSSISVAILSLIFLIIYAIVLNTPRIYDIASLYLSLGTMLGVMALVVFTQFESLFGMSKSARWAYLIYAIVVNVLYSARAPMLFLFLVISLYLMLRLLKNRELIIKIRTVSIEMLYNRFILIGLSLMLGFLFFIRSSQFVVDLLERAYLRFSMLASSLHIKGAGGSSIDTRVDYLDYTITEIINSPKTLLIGNGFASFGILYSGNDVKMYPHNIVLETIFELGLLGLAILVLWVILNSIPSLTRKATINWTVLLFLGLNYLKSSSLADLRLFAIFLALSSLAYKSSELIKNSQHYSD